MDENHALQLVVLKDALIPRADLPRCQNGVAAEFVVGDHHIALPLPSKLTIYFPIPSVCGLQHLTDPVQDILHEKMTILHEPLTLHCQVLGVGH
jgi:hypothetical protein